MRFALAVRRGAGRFTTADAGAVITRLAENGRELGADQAAAVRGVLTSGAMVEVLSAAAGTGKSFVVGTLAETWTAAGHRVFGLAPSQVAAQVLAEEGVTARNVARWLATQSRLDKDRPGSPDPGGDREWRLRRGDLVVVDEAGMTATGDLAEIERRCDEAGAKLLLVGDPRQLAAVGPGGALADVAAHGLRYELAEVRRFTAPWEGPASLRLREGDRAAVGEYAKHGRLVDAGTAEQAETAAGRAWLADTLDGRESLLLVGSNEAAARASAALRADLVALGRVEQAGVQLGMQGTVAGVGDLVQARRNGWDLIGWEGNTRAPINRETYRVTGVRGDGGLTVAAVHGRDDTGEVLGEALHLPAAYVGEHLTLGYASTVHAAQGRTVDTAHAVVGAGTDAASAYVALTRGRDRNTAYGVTVAVAADNPAGEANSTEQRSTAAVLADVLERAEVQRSALAEAEYQADLARSVQRSVDRLAAEVADATAGRTGAVLDRLAATGALDPEHRAALAADEAFGSLDRLLRTVELAGHDPAAVLTAAVRERSLDGALSPAQVLHHRIATALHGQLTPRLAAAGDLIPRGLPEGRHGRLTTLADAADTRRHELGTQVAAEAPPWATEALGPVPADPIGRAEWEHKAGWAAAYRELAGHTDETDPLGPAPGTGLAEKAALFRTAHAALDLPDRGHDEADLSDGRLRLRVRAMAREETWAPRFVEHELAATHHQAQRACADAAHWAARADVATDPAERGRLRAAAVVARQEADALAEQAAALEAADAARGRWFEHTAATRDAAERARVELGARGVDVNDPADRVTAAEWLAAHQAEQAVADADREVTGEHELTDTAAVEDVDAGADARIAAETAVPDARDISTAEPTETADAAEQDLVRTAEQTAASVRRAQIALAEIAARRQADSAREAADAERRAELADWAARNRAAAEDAARARDDELALER